LTSSAMPGSVVTKPRKYQEAITFNIWLRHRQCPSPQ
jgi:hypothetical protein